MSHADAVRRASGALVLLGYVDPRLRLHGRWWRRWYAYAPSLPSVEPEFGLTAVQAQRRLRRRLVERYLDAAR